MYCLPKGDRTEKRKALIELFLLECPGEGNGNRASRYQYDVEEFTKDGISYGIFLLRPTWLNKGFDFTVNVQGMYFKSEDRRKHPNPSHQEIKEALSNCKKKCQKEYSKVVDAITEIFNCKEPDISGIDAYFEDFEGTKRPIQIILLALKWLFMEQDCAYWNFSGRLMFYEDLQKNQLA